MVTSPGEEVEGDERESLECLIQTLCALVVGGTGGMVYLFHGAGLFLDPAIKAELGPVRRGRVKLQHHVLFPL